jgi:geranylgeranylglycerol-phosphate geranylgeranyltransferase
LSTRAAISIIRPINCAMIGFAVIVGEFVSRPPHISVPQSALGFLTGFFICAYSMVVNDVYDIEVDRVNQPDRPLPSGRLSLSLANRLSMTMLLLGIAASVLSLSIAAVAIALLYAFLSWLYNSRAKQAGLPGNLIVASSLAIPFIYGGVVGGGDVLGSLLLMMAFTAFSAGVGREVVKAMSDTEGDKKRGIRSVAMTRGLRAASAVGAVFFLLAVVTSWLPLILRLADTFYQLGVLVPDAIFVYLAASIIARPTAKNAHRVKTVALAGMLAGLIVFIGGAF